MAIEIRLATPEDARGIQEMHYQTWLATYPNKELGITIDDIKDRFQERMTDAGVAKRRDQLANQKENQINIVAKDGEKIIGWAAATRHTDRNQLGAIYILPEYHRQGIGMLLWTGIKKIFDPAKETFVNVATYNTGAIEFYKNLGFQETDKRFTDERFKMKSGAVLPEMEMVLKAG